MRRQRRNKTRSVARWEDECPQNEERIEMDVGKMKTLSSSDQSCISRISDTQVTVGVDRAHFDNLTRGVALFLNSKLQ